MLFPKNKLVPVKYIIDTNDFPKGIYPNIKEYNNVKQLGCPAVSSTSKKLFYVNSPISFKLEFGLKDNEPYYHYEFDTKVHKEVEKVHNILQKNLELQYSNNVMSIQLLTPYVFITDTKDVSVMTVPPPLNYNNCSYVSGELYIKDWVRHLNVALVLLDNSKPATVDLSVDTPMLMFAFNKQIDLKYTEMTDKIYKYQKQITGIVNYRKGIMNLYEDIKSRRPKNLL